MQDIKFFYIKRFTRKLDISNLCKYNLKKIYRLVPRHCVMTYTRDHYKMIYC